MTIKELYTNLTRLQDALDQVLFLKLLNKQVEA